MNSEIKNKDLDFAKIHDLLNKELDAIINKKVKKELTNWISIHTENHLENLKLIPAIRLSKLKILHETESLEDFINITNPNQIFSEISYCAKNKSWNSIYQNLSKSTQNSKSGSYEKIIQRSLLKSQQIDNIEKLSFSHIKECEQELLEHSNIFKNYIDALKNASKKSPLYAGLRIATGVAASFLGGAIGGPIGARFGRKITREIANGVLNPLNSTTKLSDTLQSSLTNLLHKIEKIIEEIEKQTPKYLFTIYAQTILNIEKDLQSLGKTISFIDFSKNHMEISLHEKGTEKFIEWATPSKDYILKLIAEKKYVIAGDSATLALKFIESDPLLSCIEDKNTGVPYSIDFATNRALAINEIANAAWEKSLTKDSAYLYYDLIQGSYICWSGYIKNIKNQKEDIFALACIRLLITTDTQNISTLNQNEILQQIISQISQYIYRISSKDQFIKIKFESLPETTEKLLGTLIKASKDFKIEINPWRKIINTTPSNKEKKKFERKISRGSSGFLIIKTIGIKDAWNYRKTKIIKWAIKDAIKKTLALLLTLSAITTAILSIYFQ